MIPQYAQSTDPEVVAAVEAMHQLRREFHADAMAFAHKYAVFRDGHWNRDIGFYGGSGPFGSNSYGVSAIISPFKPTQGNWTRGPGGRGWRPFKADPAYKEMRGLAKSGPAIPGVPKEARSSAEGDRLYWLSPTLFVHDGVAYLGYSMLPNGHSSPLGEQWTEILASTYHAALEGYNAALKAVTTDA